MNLHSNFSRHFYWPLVQKIKGENAAAVLEELSASQWKSQDEINYQQWQLVEKVVCKAAVEVPHYQNSFKKIGWDFSIHNFSYDEFRQLPIVKKKDLRDNITEFLNPNYTGRVTSGKTSGSTGHSIIVYNDSEQETYSEACRWRAKEWWGVSPGSAHVSFWGRPFTSLKDVWTQKTKSFLMNNLLFSAFELSEEKLEAIWKKISRFKPSIIYGYPSAIYPFARYLKEGEKPANCLGLKVIMTTAETITSQQRYLIEQVFGCKTANEYGCSETGGFVYECPQGNWHISSEVTFIEFLDEDGNPQPYGENGDIVVTHLRNHYMPLIRYKIGDIGSSQNGLCGCGRALPLMNVSVAKETDIIRLANGDTYSSEIFDYINLAVVKSYPGSILQFRVVQKELDRFDIDIVSGSDSQEQGKALFKRLIKNELGDDIKIHINAVKEIVRETSGKLRYFISEVN